MKKTIFAASAVLALIAGSAAFAQQGGGNPITFESLDSDGDDKVTKEEFKENFNPPARNGRTPDPEMIFGRWDGDGDGEITAEEYENRPQRQQPPAAAPEAPPEAPSAPEVDG
jgi:hypothetical protein